MFQIACVRTVVANYSNDEILLVLEHNDYDVNVTISDFLEGMYHFLFGIIKKLIYFNTRSNNYLIPSCILFIKF